MKNKLVVLSWGRMNPCTTGHESLVEVVVGLAKKMGGIPEIYLSHSQDKKKNPLPYDAKIKMAQKAFGNVIRKSNKKNIIQLLQDLDKTYDSLLLVVGADRVPEFTKLLQKYNGKEFVFTSIDVVSAGDRDPDSEGVTGMSASKMRKAVAEGDFSTFYGGLPKKLKSNSKHYFDLLQKHMGIG